MRTLYDAIDQRREVAFVHLGKRRRIQPYALRHGEGSWWVDGLDIDADGPRSFPVARVEQPDVGPPNAYERPRWTRPPTNDPLTWRRSVPTQVTLEVEAEFAPDARAAFAPIIIDDAGHRAGAAASWTSCIAQRFAPPSTSSPAASGWWRPRRSSRRSAAGSSNRCGH